MDYKIPQPEDGASEVREPAVAYCPSVRAAEPWMADSGFGPAPAGRRAPSDDWLSPEEDEVWDAVLKDDPADIQERIDAFNRLDRLLKGYKLNIDLDNKVSDTMLASEHALAKDWLSPEEDEAWSFL